MDRKLRMGMIGGGKGSFIGGVHRMAAIMDGKIELVCGAFNSNAKRSKETGRELFLPDDRVYNDFREMIRNEKKLPSGEKMDFVCIATPNNMHYEPARLALENGFHVICDKPVTYNLDEARELKKMVDDSGLIFCLTHNYTGYPMVKQAKEMCRLGKLGNVRKIVVEYPQGWLTGRPELSGQKQASWRTDSSISGLSCSMGDIGTHAENLTEYITGLKIHELCADLSTIEEGRATDDDGSVLIRFDNGAKGILYVSQISVGEENGLKIRIYGEKAALEWVQTEPNTLQVKYQDKPMEIYRTGIDNGYLEPLALKNTRIPSGHPEGFIEAFANIYSNFADALSAFIQNQSAADYVEFPAIDDGLRGMAFIESVVNSSKSDKKWYPFLDY